MKYKKLLFIPILFICLCTKAEKYYELNTTCQQAYKEIISLRISNGITLLNAEKLAHPDNLIPLFIENYADFFSLYFNENPTEFEIKSPLKAERLEAMKSGPESSPWHLFTQCIINVQWAAIHAKFGEKWAAGWAFKAAFDLAKANAKAFPAFTPNNMIMGPLQMAAGTIPKGYKWLGGMLGIKGNTVKGMQVLTGFINSKDANASIFRDEALFYYCYLRFYIESKPDEVLAFIKSQKLDIVNNHLFTYMAANLSLNNQQSAATKTIVQQRNLSPAYLSTPVWDFEMAHAKLYHLETDANIYFERFLNNFKGNYYVKDSWLKLAWFYLLQGNASQYSRCLEQVKLKGNAETDADKKALKEAKSGVVPNPLLLKARLLSDGGYTAEAFEILKGKQSSDFVTEEHKLEFAYRVARIFEELGKYDAAVQAYLSTIKIGKERTEYYAARAALQIGTIYEQQKKNKIMAISFYQQCLDMDDHDYKNSLDQRAKAGIERCSGR